MIRRPLFASFFFVIGVCAACGGSSDDSAPATDDGAGGNTTGGSGGSSAGSGGSTAGSSGTAGSGTAGKGGSGGGTAGSGGSTAGAGGSAAGAGGSAAGAGGSAAGAGGSAAGAGGSAAGAGGSAAGAGGSAAGAGGGATKPGACTNAADAAIVAMKDATAKNAQACGMSCFLNANQSMCAQDCMKMKSGFSDGCSKCWGDVIACGIKMCGGQCISPSSQGCLDCTAAMCTPAFDACAGVPLSGKTSGFGGSQLSAFSLQPGGWSSEPGTEFGQPGSEALAADTRWNETVKPAAAAGSARGPGARSGVRPRRAVRRAAPARGPGLKSRA